MPKHRAEQPQQRPALDDRGHPTQPGFQVGEDVALHEFGDQLPELGFAQFAVLDGRQGQLRQAPAPRSGTSRAAASKSPAVQVVLQLAQELRLRLLAGEPQGQHAPPQQDHAKQPPEKIQGQKAVAAVAEQCGQFVDVES